MKDIKEEGLKHLEDLQKKCFELEGQNKQLRKQIQDKDILIKNLLCKLKDIEIKLSVFAWGRETPLDNAIRDMNDTITRLQRYKKEYIKYAEQVIEAKDILHMANKGFI